MMMLTFRYGQAPNLPWWKVMNMSYGEIKKFNDGFMIEVTSNAK